MIKAARVDLSANRWTPFVYDVDILGIDLTGAVLRAQIRVDPGAANPPLIDLPLVADGSNGVRFLGANRSGDAIVSSIRIQISQAAMQAMPTGVDVEDDVPLDWDFVVTPAGGTLDRWLYGAFIVLAGVTR